MQFIEINKVLIFELINSKSFSLFLFSGVSLFKEKPSGESAQPPIELRKFKKQKEKHTSLHQLTMHKCFKRETLFKKAFYGKLQHET